MRDPGPEVTTAADDTISGPIRRAVETSPSAPAASWLPPVLFGLLGVVVAAAFSWVPSFWYDEAASVSASRRSLGDLWALMHEVDAVHGLYYAGLHVWTDVFGVSEFAVRFPSAVAVGVATAGVWVLARQNGTRGFAHLAAVVFIVLPRVTWMGTEGRSYAMTAAVAVWATVLLIRLLRTDGRWWGWIGYGLLGGLGVALNVYVALLAPVHLAAILLLRRPFRVRPILWWGAAWAVALVVTWPIVRLILGQSGQLPYPDVDWFDYANQLLLTQYFAGALPTYSRPAPWPPIGEPWSWAIVALATVGWALAAIGAVSLARAGGPSRGLALTLIAWIAIPTVTVVAYSALATPMYAPRYFCFTTPAMALLIAAGVGRFRRVVSRALVVGLIVLLALPIYAAQRTPVGKNNSGTKSVATYVQDHAVAGDAVYVGFGANTVIAAYPAPFAGMAQPGLRGTAADTDRLFDVHAPIDDGFEVADDVEALWLIDMRATDLGVRRAEQAAARLHSLGFTQVDFFDGSLQRVSRWVRDDD